MMQASSNSVIAPLLSRHETRSDGQARQRSTVLFGSAQFDSLAGGFAGNPFFSHFAGESYMQRGPLIEPKS
jgi:hypothetical protein